MPAGTALFGSSSRNQSKNLLEFKAGKMSMKGKTVYPDKRKGLVYIYQSEDSLMHFCWKDRSSGTVEDDLIIFPDDVEFKHISQCTTGRVYLLKFKSSSRKFFFWVQEPKTEKDEENCRKVNEILNNPPALGSQRSGGATPDCDLQNLLSNMSQQQLMQLFGGVGQISGLSNLLSHINRPSSGSGSGGNGSTTTTAGSGGTTTTASSGGTTSSPAATTGSATAASPAVPATPSTPVSSGPMAPPTPAAPTRGVSKAKVELSPTFLQSCLSRIQDPSTPTSTRTPQQTQVDLSTSMTTETLGAILNDAGLVRELERHLPALEGCQQDQLSSTLASPQFHQAVSMFSNALQSGQLAPVVSQFEVGDEAVSAAAQGNMEDFVKALQAANISNAGSTGGASAGSTMQSPNSSNTPQSEEKAKTTEKSPREDDDNMSLD